MQRKATKKTRGPNSDEKAFQAWLKNRPCAVSGVNFVEVHHCKGSSFRHNKELVGHWFCIPLSSEKHREYHAGTKAFRDKYGPQSMIWLHELATYHEETGLTCPYEVEKAILDYGK